MVYLAIEKRSGKKIALKKIAKSLITKFNYEFRLRREIEIHCHLNYVHITKLYGYFKSEKNIYLVLEYCPDGTLFEYLKNSKIDLEFIRRIGYQLAKAISYLH